MLNAQPEMLWSETYGGESRETLYSMVQTADSGFALAGFTNSYGSGGSDMWLVRTDKDGGTIWTNTFGGDSLDECLAIIQTIDGGFALAGYTESFGSGGRDMWLVKTDEEGDSLWSKTYGGENWDYCRDIIQTADSGYVLAGYTTSFGAGEDDMWLVKTNADGDSLWSETYGGRNWEACYSVLQTEDGGFALAGGTFTYGPGSYSMWLVKTDAEGVMEWAQAYGGTDYDWCVSAVQTSDGGFALAGYTASFDVGLSDAWLIKTDENGDSLWAQSYGGVSYDRCFSLLTTEDDGFVLGGYTGSSGAGVFDMWLIRCDVDGETLWDETFGGAGSEWCYSVIQTADGGYALGGHTYTIGAGENDMWLVKTSVDPVSVPNENHPILLNEFVLMPAYPNPFNSTTTITYGLPYPSNILLQVYNPSGQRITTLFEGNEQPGFHSATIVADNLPSGIYFVQLKSLDQVFTQKVILIR